MIKLTKEWLEEKIGKELGQPVSVIKLDKDDDPKGYMGNVHNIQVATNFFIIIYIHIHI